MLNHRRVVEFSSRVHSYLLALYIFFVLLFGLSSYLPVAESFFRLVTVTSHVLGWTMILFGIWILIASLLLTIRSRVLCLKPVLLTLLRTSVMLVLSIVLDTFRILLVDGVTIGV